MASATGREISPIAAGIAIAVVLALVVGVGWFWLGRSSGGSTRTEPARPPRLPAGIPPPPQGMIAKPDSAR